MGAVIRISKLSECCRGVEASIAISHAAEPLCETHSLADPFDSVGRSENPGTGAHGDKQAVGKNYVAQPTPRLGAGAPGRPIHGGTNRSRPAAAIAEPHEQTVSEGQPENATAVRHLRPVRSIGGDHHVTAGAREITAVSKSHAPQAYSAGHRTPLPRGAI